MDIHLTDGEILVLMEALVEASMSYSALALKATLNDNVAEYKEYTRKRILVNDLFKKIGEETKK